jgi:predicted DNA binding CopG/RHH family protein
MREHYDFSKLKRVKSPYTKLLKQPVTMRLDRDSVAYFKQLAEEMGIPYQNLINLYLRECASKQLKPSLDWKPKSATPVTVRTRK